MNKASTGNRDSIIAHGAGWLGILLGIVSLIYSCVSSNSTDAKVNEAMSLARNVVAEQARIRKGDPLLLEQDALLSVEQSSLGENSKQQTFMTIRNLGDDAISDLWIAWYPMHRPIPKEAPNDQQRLAISKKIQQIEISHSKLSGTIVAKNETVNVLSIPKIFEICFEHPGIEFYGNVHLGWRHRIEDAIPCMKAFMYRAKVANGRLQLEVSKHVFLRGSQNEFADPLFPK